LSFSHQNLKDGLLLLLLEAQSVRVGEVVDLEHVEASV
jgi:hypothetical protein